eukprot:COSAG02_NODE_12909_length_1473_cov_3.029840_2_plen_99_part_00
MHGAATVHGDGGETKDLNTSGRRPADGLDDRASEPSAGNSVRGVAPLADPVEEHAITEAAVELSIHRLEETRHKDNNWNAHLKNAFWRNTVNTDTATT